MIELKNKVDELALHNEYQLRLKDMNYSEKIKVCLVYDIYWNHCTEDWSFLMHVRHYTLLFVIYKYIPSTPFKQEITEQFTQDLEQSKHRFGLLRWVVGSHNLDALSSRRRI